MDRPLEEDMIMNRWMNRLAMSLIVSFGFVTARAPAQTPLIPLNEPIDMTPVTPHGILLARQSAASQGKQSLLNAAGYNCESHPDWYGSGNWKTEFDFIFGSSRHFFYEPCLRKTHTHSSIFPIFGKREAQGCAQP